MPVAKFSVGDRVLFTSPDELHELLKTEVTDVYMSSDEKEYVYSTIEYGLVFEEQLELLQTNRNMPIS